MNSEIDIEQLTIKLQSTGLNRNTIDKFYTSIEVVKLCMDNFTKHIIVSESDLIIEPSAGNGAWIDELKKLSAKCLFYDIMP
jgi:hypothetical protein